MIETTIDNSTPETPATPAEPTPNLPSPEDIVASLKAKAQAPQAPEATTEKPTEPPPQDKNALRIAEAARRERKALEIEKQTKELQASIEKERQELKAFNELKEKYKANPGKYDPAEVLNHLGVDVNTFIKALIDGDKPESIEEKVARLEKEREEEKRAALEAKTKAEQQEEEQALAQLQESIKDTIQKNLDTYELIHISNAYDAVLETMQAHWDQTQEILPIEEAAQMVENYLFDESTKNLKASKKIAKLFQPAEPPKPTSMVQAANSKGELHSASSLERSSASGSKTLKPMAVPTPVDAPAFETHEQAIERIINKFRNNQPKK